MRSLVRIIAMGSLAAIAASCASMNAGGSRPAAASEFRVGDMPPGVHVRVTDQGPVFTDDSGKTLYSERTGKQGRSDCKVAWEADENLHPLLMVYAKYPAPPCTQQWPPLLAQEGSAPTGDWSIIVRAEGTKQWAYKGFPVHTSYLDFEPGDVNGAVVAGGANAGYGKNWSVVSPPMNSPPGVSYAMRNGVGLIAMSQGRALYTLPSDGRAPKGQHTSASPRATSGDCIGSCSGKWSPLYAGETSNPVGAWSILGRPDGTRQWTHDGRALFVYDGDTAQADLNGFGVDHAVPVVLYPTPRPPVHSGIAVRRILVGPVYTDAKGMTLYAFNCTVRSPGTAELGGDAFICRGWNDDVSQREQFCAAPDKCGEMWQPLQAPANTPPQGGTWSVAIIPDPARYPLRWVPAAGKVDSSLGAIKVWTFRGRPLYTSVQDRVPGDFEGHAIHQNSGQRWSALLAGDLEN
jgi:predicted lipoprotein with Yx(FWY)xxD motif